MLPRGPKSPGGVLGTSLEPETHSRRCGRNGSASSRKPPGLPALEPLSRPRRPRHIQGARTFPESQTCSPRRSPHRVRGEAGTREEQGLPRGHLPRLGPGPPAPLQPQEPRNPISPATCSLWDPGVARCPLRVLPAAGVSRAGLQPRGAVPQTLRGGRAAAGTPKADSRGHSIPQPGAGSRRGNLRRSWVRGAVPRVTQATK